MTTDGATQTNSLYFAYGSNLSPTQMAKRCPGSSPPVALALLRGYSWLINQRGYANVVHTGQAAHMSNTASGLPKTEDQASSYYMNNTWGLLYELSPQDETLLDGYEGVDLGAAPIHTTPTSADPSAQPDTFLDWREDKTLQGWEQGHGAYAKRYLPVEILQWYRAPSSIQTTIALVYVDELRVEESAAKTEYVGRMNRALREAGELGLPEEWVRRVVRRCIPADGGEADADRITPGQPWAEEKARWVPE